MATPHCTVYPLKLNRRFVEAAIIKILHMTYQFNLCHILKNDTKKELLYTFYFYIWTRGLLSRSYQ